ncbi:MAG: type III-B CRISPR module-associated Cmr3 family protein [Thermomicrobiales bacterium]
MSVTTNAAPPTTLLLRPRDPIILRDARPFSTDPGARAFTLDWPLPSTIAGALRTHIGTASGVDWTNPAARARALGIAIRGAFLVDRVQDGDPWTPYFPAPADAVVYRPEDEGGKDGEDGEDGEDGKDEEPRVMRLWPDESLADDEAAGCDMPTVNDLKLLPMTVERDEKPEPGYHFWSLKDTIAWLIGGDGLPTRHRTHIEQELRVHVAVSGDTLTSVEGRLFATTGLAFSPASRPRWKEHPESAILCGVGLPAGSRIEAWTPQPAFLPLGGERRQARLTGADQIDLDPWTIPPELVQALEGETRLRLQLVTPAIFRTGWCPGWLTQRHRDRNPAQINGLGLKLRAAAVGRRVPISGWDLTNGCEKPVRYAAPAGSVYFFDVAEPLTAERITKLWLAPLSDGVYNREDGFGLVVPGVWNTSGARASLSTLTPSTKGGRTWPDACSTSGR